MVQAMPIGYRSHGELSSCHNLGVILREYDMALLNAGACGRWRSRSSARSASNWRAAALALTLAFGSALRSTIFADKVEIRGRRERRNDRHTGANQQGKRQGRRHHDRRSEARRRHGSRNNRSRDRGQARRRERGA
jgi:hypothetical protein